VTAFDITLKAFLDLIFCPRLPVRGSGINLAHFLA
jgi:hypothetical protein